MINSCLPRQISRISLLSQKCKFSTSVDTPLSENDQVNPELYNRNPRNLERLRIAYKPCGYHLEVPGVEYWHKLNIYKTGRHLTAKVVHYQGAVVVEASTKEWCIRKHLYRTLDQAAFENLARVLAQRCLESGLIEMESGLKTSEPETKIGKFATILEEHGISLKEPPRFRAAQPWDLHRPQKPWEVTE